MRPRTVVLEFNRNERERDRERDEGLIQPPGDEGERGRMPTRGGVRSQGRGVSTSVTDVC